MVQQGHEQLPSMGVVSGTYQMPYGTAAYQSNQMVMSNPPIITSSSTQLTDKPTVFSASPSHLAQHQLAYQQIRQQQLHQQLQTFWANQHIEIEQTTDFKNHSLPLARIKKIMKADEDVRMIAAEAPVVFARACEMFILELTLRSWNHTEENKRRTLQKNDIAAAISRTDIFDFLVDIVPREDFKDEVIGIATGSVPSIRAPADSLPYFYMPAQNTPLIGAPGMIMGKPVVDQAVYTQQAHPYVAPPMWPQHQLQQQTES